MGPGTPLSVKDAVRDYDGAKAPQLAEKSVRGYRATLHELSREFGDAPVSTLEPPAGTQLLDALLDDRWGERAPRTYNRHLSVFKDFSAWLVRSNYLAGNPAEPIKRKPVDQTRRSAFTDADRDAVLRANPDVRDSVALRLLLDYGVTKGTLQKARFGDFDQQRNQAVLRARRDRPHTLHIADEQFWSEFNELVALVQARDSHYLIPRSDTRRRRPPRAKDLDLLQDQLETLERTASELSDGDRSTESEIAVSKLTDAVEFVRLWRMRARTKTTVFPSEPKGEHALHDWWYRCLGRAGIVSAGDTHGQRMLKARHTVGRRVLSRTGLKAVQEQLGIGSGGSTGDVYSNRDADELDTTMRDVLRGLRGVSEEKL